jgi:hypothetical protein
MHLVLILLGEFVDGSRVMRGRARVRLLYAYFVALLVMKYPVELSRLAATRPRVTNAKD